MALKDIEKKVLLIMCGSFIVGSGFSASWDYFFNKNTLDINPILIVKNSCECHSEIGYGSKTLIYVCESPRTSREELK